MSEIIMAILNAQRDIMAMTLAEKAHSDALKIAIGNNKELKPLCDLEIAHLAIVRGENVEYAMDTAYKMQCFRETFKIQDTVEDGMETIQAYMRLQPGCILDLSYLPIHGTFSLSMDNAAFKPQVFYDSEENWRTYVAAHYYLLRCTATDFFSIRTGVAILCECEGMTASVADVKLLEKAVYEFWSFYPSIYKETIWLNTPSYANLCYSILKPLVSRELSATWRIGESIHGFEGRRLTELFHMPDPEAAEASMMDRIQRYMTERFHREKVFELDSATVVL